MSYALYIHLQGNSPPYLVAALRRYENVRFVRRLERGLEILAAPKKHHPMNTHLNPFGRVISHMQQTALLGMIPELIKENEVTFYKPNYELDGGLPDVVIINGSPEDYEQAKNKIEELSLEKLLKTPQEIAPKTKGHIAFQDPAPKE